MLKFLLKKEHLDFMDGWKTSEAVMEGVPKGAHDLGSLFTDDPDAALDVILNKFSTYDRE
jgi:hypothetical protein